MTGIKDATYQPDPAHAGVYEELFALFRDVHDAFGGVNESASLGRVMKRLLEIKESQAAR
jgi:L-ribulokinase